MIKLLMLLLFLPASALANPPPKGSLDDQLLTPFSKEIKGVQHHGYSCCEIGDGTAVLTRWVDDHWEIKLTPDGHERFPDAPKDWFVVRDDEVTDGFSPVDGYGVMWWRHAELVPGHGLIPGSVRCFQPPHGVY